jgi:large subunit ribosomal protein LP1
MATAFNTLDAATRDQMGCTFATLMLHDMGTEVNATNMNKVLTAAGLTVAPYWPMLFANALDGKNVGDFLAVSGGSGGAQAGPVATGGQTKAAEAEKEPEVEEEGNPLIIYTKIYQPGDHQIFSLYRYAI